MLLNLLFLSLEMRRNYIDGVWTWGDSVLPDLNDYIYLGVKVYMQWSLGCTPERFSDIW